MSAGVNSKPKDIQVTIIWDKDKLRILTCLRNKNTPGRELKRHYTYVTLLLGCLRNNGEMAPEGVSRNTEKRGGGVIKTEEM